MPKKPREPASPESQIPAIQASEPPTMTTAVTIAERLLTGGAMVALRSALDYAIGAQPGDLARAQAQHLAQDRVGVLAEHRRRQSMLERRPREAHRARHQRELSRDRMLELDFHAARLDLRLVEHLRDVVDRAVGDARRLQQVDPLVRGLLHEDRLEETRELGAVLHPLAVRGEARIVGELGTAGDLAELAVEIVVAAGEDHAPVLSPEGLIRNDVRMQVADALGRLAGGEVVGVLVGEERDLRIEQREIEMLPGTAFAAVRERGADRDRGVHPGDD